MSNDKRHEFTNFHQHSSYSFLDGASTPKSIVKRAAELGMKYVCISDHGNVAGNLEMYDEARAAGLIPVLGTELYTVDDRYDNGKKSKGFHLCIWAMNEEGLHNMWAISSNSYYGTGEGHRAPNARWEHVEGLGKGVACTSACLGGAISKAAANDDEEMALYFSERLSSVFEEFYIEIHTNSMPEQRKVNLWLMDFAERHGYRTVYAVDSHYALKEDAEFHDMWLGCQTKSFYDEDHWKMDHEYYMQSEDEVRSRLEYLGEKWVERCFDGVDHFLSKIESIEMDNSHKVPKFPLPEGWDDSGKYMKWLCARALLEKVAGVEVLPNSEDDPVGMVRFRGKPKVDLEPYLRQLHDDELPIILDHGLADYFLIVSDYCRYAKRNMLVGPGRGSCTASIVCYLLDITEVDPIGKGLIFSRFLNEGRMASLPDIDLDFPDDRKHMVHEYLIDTYGDEYVTAVGTTTFFGMKLALKEVCRYYRFPMADSNRITRIVGEMEEMASDMGGSWRDMMPNVDPQDSQFLMECEQSFPDLFAKAERMVGLARQQGKHAAGYVISPMPLAKLLPIRKSSNDEIISQFDKVAVERMGFLKADILGLRNLTTLSMAERYVEERTGEKIDYYTLSDDPSDMELWSQFDKGRTLGIFQMEGAGITGVARATKPRSILDLSTILALYRPGVIGAGMLDEYLARVAGEKPVEYITPELEPILGDTYGVIVYQEQAMRIFTDLAGFNDEEADHIRAAIGKKKLEKILAEKPKFLAGCSSRGISEDRAEAIFKQIEASGSYSFNKAHSYGYGTVTFWTAYMKAHHPVEYYAACMSTVGFDKAPLYMREAKRRGIGIVPPSIEKFGRDYTIMDNGDISFGLINVKGVGEKVIASMCDGYPYSSFEDFVDRSGANSSVVKILIRAGFFRSIHPNSRDLLERFEGNDYRANLFGESLDDSSRFSFDCERAPWPIEKVARIETELFGMPLSVDPFDKYRNALGPAYDLCSTAEEMEASGYGTAHTFLVKVTSVRTHMAKNGIMAFVEMSTDRDEHLEATAFSDLYSAGQIFIKEGRYLRVEVLKNQYKGKVSLQLNKVQDLSNVQ